MKKLVKSRRLFEIFSSDALFVGVVILTISILGLWFFDNQKERLKRELSPSSLSQQTRRLLANHNLDFSDTDHLNGWASYNLSGKGISLLLSKNATSRFPQELYFKDCAGEKIIGDFESVIEATPEETVISALRGPGSLKRNRSAFVLPDEAGMPRFEIKLDKSHVSFHLSSNDEMAVFDFNGSQRYEIPTKTVVNGRYQTPLPSEGSEKSLWFVWSKDSSVGRDSSCERQSKDCLSFLGDLALEIRIERTLEQCIVHFSHNEVEVESVEQKWNAVINSQGQAPIKEVFDLRTYAIGEYKPVEDELLFNRLLESGDLQIDFGSQRLLYPGDDDLLCSDPNNKCLGAIPDIRDKNLVGKMLHGGYAGTYVKNNLDRYNERRLFSGYLTTSVTAADQWRATLAGSPGVVLALRRKGIPKPFRFDSNLDGDRMKIGRFRSHESGASLTQNVQYTYQSDAPTEVAFFGENVNVTQGQNRITSKRSLRFQGNNVGAKYDIKGGSSPVSLEVSPLSCTDNCSYFKYDDKLPVYFASKLHWDSDRVTPPGPPDSDKTVKNLAITDRNGYELFVNDSLSDVALEAGLEPLLGKDTAYPEHIGRMLSRFATRSDIELSLDLDMQARLYDVVQSFSNELLSGDSVYNDEKPNGREVVFVFMDATSSSAGQILAAAQNDAVVSGDTNDKASLLSDERFAADTSWLRWKPGFQPKNYRRFPGSSFKLITASGILRQQRKLEKLMGEAGQSKEYIRDNRRLIQGVNRSTLNRVGRSNRFSFDPDSVYPYHENGRGKQIRNSRRGSHRPIGIPENGIGLVDALEKSHNTWFAWANDRVTPAMGFMGGRERRASELGLIKLPTFSTKELYELVPLFEAAGAFGLDRGYNLLEGVTREFGTGAYKSHYLHPVFFDRFEKGEYRFDQYALRRMSIGSQVSASVIHMAMVAAGIAVNQRVTPTLLAGVEHESSQPLLFDESDLALLSRAMHAVVKTGTGKKHLAKLPINIWAKTGTADYKRKEIINGREIEKFQQNAWMVGWICPVEGECQSNRVSFACLVRPANAGGGDRCGELLRKVIEEVFPEASTQK